MHSRQASAQIDAYLEQIAAHLVRMPAGVRGEQMDELRQHLEWLTAQYGEVGVLPREAVEEAIRQFGDPVRLGQRLLREWRLTERQAIRERRAPVRYALKALIGTSVFCFWFCDPLLAYFHSSRMPTDFSLICFVPVFAGALTGWRWPRRALKALLQAVLILSIASLSAIVCLCLIVVVLHDLSARGSTISVFTDVHALSGLFEFVIVGCLRWISIWSPLGLLSAYLASILKQRVSVSMTPRRG